MEIDLFEILKILGIESLNGLYNINYILRVGFNIIIDSTTIGISTLSSVIEEILLMILRSEAITNNSKEIIEILKEQGIIDNNILNILENKWIKKWFLETDIIEKKELINEIINIILNKEEIIKENEKINQMIIDIKQFIEIIESEKK